VRSFRLSKSDLTDQGLEVPDFWMTVTAGAGTLTIVSSRGEELAAMSGAGPLEFVGVRAAASVAALAHKRSLSMRTPGAEVTCGEGAAELNVAQDVQRKVGGSALPLTPRTRQ